jgi:hypothetical protein
MYSYNDNDLPPQTFAGSYRQEDHVVFDINFSQSEMFGYGRLTHYFKNNGMLKVLASQSQSSIDLIEVM